MDAQTRLAVVGSPITHSKSPELHLAAYEQLGLDWDYERIEIQAGDLKGFLQTIDGSWLGLSVTMPLKQEALALTGWQDETSSLLGVANTLKFNGDEVRSFNTDVLGAQAAITSLGVNRHNEAIILGNGATASSVLLALFRIGFRSVKALARSSSNFEALERLAEALGVKLTTGPIETDPGEADVIVSTLPGTVGLVRSFPTSFRTQTPLFDVAYNPSPTPLALHWRDADGTVTTGLEMLLNQALFQVRIFVADDPDVELANESDVLSAMRRAIGLAN
ncbi:MAG: shikimate dehydrogenase [Microbacteriaceae bacterium]|nr:shikimate dehydrogenase [Microbacteriaceae bacterium]